jgi:superfamily II DNA or RNA helicase
MRFKTLSPHKGYRRDYLWLPKLHINNLAGVKASLTFPIANKASIHSWNETEHHLVVPREFIPFQDYKDLTFEIENATFNFPKLDGLTLKYNLRGPIQRIGYKSLVEKGSGVLSLACGRGKTVVALHAWAASAMPCLVVVDTKNLLYQWIERIEEHTNIKKDEIGIIGDGKQDWEHPITVASIRTLAGRARDFSLPDEFDSHFGVSIYDEVHHLGAPYFNQTAAVCRGLRWGLSATHERDDGLDNLYKYHIGPVVYENLKQDLIPECFFIQTGVQIFPSELRKLEVRGDINFQRLSRWLSECKSRNELIFSYLDRCREEKRKVLVLSHVVDHVKHLWEQNSKHLPSGLIYGDVPGEKRSAQLNDFDMVFATTQLAKEALDRKDLDTIVVALPFRKRGVLQQVIGRIQREMAGKKTPLVIVFEDESIRTTSNQCRSLRAYLTEMEYPWKLVED